MNKNLPILYSFRRCPYAMRARFALISEQIVYEHREVDLKNKPAEMLAISPKGTVPVLLLANGKVLEESLDIMIWALNIVPSSFELQLIKENDSDFKSALDHYKYPDRYPEQTKIDYRNQCLIFINKIESLLHPFLSGTSFGFLDMAIFPFIRQFSQVDTQWFETANFPRIKIWLTNILSDTLFEKVMEKHPYYEF